MGRKAVLEGGKREELIAAAMRLFFTNGYENTSVRMILDEVGGEIGMFYHYFKSKDELFMQVVDKFFADYQLQFAQMSETCVDKEDFIKKLLGFYEQNLINYSKLSGNLHWTIQYAMVVRTLESLRPEITKLVEKWGYGRKRSSKLIANQMLLMISATLHSEDFVNMTQEEKHNVLYEGIDIVLK